ERRSVSSARCVAPGPRGHSGGVHAQSGLVSQSHRPARYTPSASVAVASQATCASGSMRCDKGSGKRSGARTSAPRARRRHPSPTSLANAARRLARLVWVVLPPSARCMVPPPPPQGWRGEPALHLPCAANQRYPHCTVYSLPWASLCLSTRPSLARALLHRVPHYPPCCAPATPRTVGQQRALHSTH